MKKSAITFLMFLSMTFAFANSAVSETANADTKTETIKTEDQKPESSCTAVQVRITACGVTYEGITCREYISAMYDQMASAC